MIGPKYVNLHFSSLHTSPVQPQKNTDTELPSKTAKEEHGLNVAALPGELRARLPRDMPELEQGETAKCLPLAYRLEKSVSVRRNLDPFSLFSHASRLLDDCFSFRELTIRPLSSRLLVLCRNPTLLQGAQVRVFSLPNMFRNI